MVNLSNRMIVGRADLIKKTLISVGKMCVFVSRPMKIATFPRKTVTFPNGSLFFFGKETLPRKRRESAAHEAVLPAIGCVGELDLASCAEADACHRRRSRQLLSAALAPLCSSHCAAFCCSRSSSLFPSAALCSSVPPINSFCSSSSSSSSCSCSSSAPIDSFCSSSSSSSSCSSSYFISSSSTDSFTVHVLCCSPLFPGPPLPSCSPLTTFPFPFPFQLVSFI